MKEEEDTQRERHTGKASHVTTEAETSVMQRTVGHHWKLEKARQESPEQDSDGNPLGPVDTWTVDRLLASRIVRQSTLIVLKSPVCGPSLLQCQGRKTFCPLYCLTTPCCPCSETSCWWLVSVMVVPFTPHRLESATSQSLPSPRATC